MNIRDRRAIHRRSRELLAEAPGAPGKVALTYAVITAAISLISTVLAAFLTDRIADTGGLGNMGLRSMLSTGRAILPVVQVILGGCLGFGYHWAVLRMARGEDTYPQDLKLGFRYLGPVLRLMLFQAIVYAVIGFGSMYLSIYIFLATPFADPVYNVMGPVLESGSALSGSITLDAATMAALNGAIRPMFLIWAAVLLVFGLPLYYNYRMSNFCLAENPRRGALMAMALSKRMLRRNRFALLRLDLSLWWFYGLQLIISALCYGDILLPLMGVALPFSEDVSYYLFFCLSLILQTAAYYFCMNRVYVAYGLAYESLKEPPKPSEEKPNYPFPTEL